MQLPFSLLTVGVHLQPPTDQKLVAYNSQNLWIIRDKSKVPLVIKHVSERPGATLSAPHTGSWTLFQLLPTGCRHRLHLAKTNLVEKNPLSHLLSTLLTTHFCNLLFLDCIYCSVFICVAVFIFNCVFNLFIFFSMHIYQHLFAGDNKVVLIPIDSKL